MKNYLFKIILFVTIFFILPLCVSAQDKSASLGIKGGFNVSSFDGYYDDVEGRFGFLAGVTFDYSFGNNWVLMASAEFAKKGSDMNGIYHEGYVDAYYIQVPVHMGYKVRLNNNIAIIPHVGGYVAYGVGGEGMIPYIIWNTGEKKTVKEKTFESYMDSMDLGIGTGVGIEVGSLLFDANYHYGLVDLGRHIAIRNMSFEFTAAYRFKIF